MKINKIKCPRCGFPHKFGHKKRKIGDDEYEIYISCPKCYWKRVLFSGNSSKINDYYQTMKLKHQSRSDPKLNKVYLRKLRRLND